ncbi:MAG: hypothetical protein LBH84_08175 [Prevotellaceae bacterium]|nr:hypothetical protein [Prevotellaceae bacterium]
MQKRCGYGRQIICPLPVSESLRPALAGTRQTADTKFSPTVRQDRLAVL